MLTRLAFAFLLASGLLASWGAAAQPAVPAVPPLAGARPAPTAAPPPAALDAPPTSEPTGAAAGPAQASADAPPTSDAPTSAPATASGAPPTSVVSVVPNSAKPPEVVEDAKPALPATVVKNFPLTEEGNARFLAEYAARPDVKKLDGGVLYRVLHAAQLPSNGPIARGDTVTVTYRGWLIDGQVFDQTKPSMPIQFTLNALIDGWRTALMQMKVGDLWEIVIPADQAYGAEGRPGRIPPNQTLVFVVSLAKVEYAG